MHLPAVNRARIYRDDDRQNRTTSAVINAVVPPRSIQRGQGCSASSSTKDFQPCDIECPVIPIFTFTFLRDSFQRIFYHCNRALLYNSGEIRYIIRLPLQNDSVENRFVTSLCESNKRLYNFIIILQLQGVVEGVMKCYRSCLLSLLE